MSNSYILSCEKSLCAVSKILRVTTDENFFPNNLERTAHQ